MIVLINRFCLILYLKIYAYFCFLFGLVLIRFSQAIFLYAHIFGFLVFPCFYLNSSNFNRFIFVNSDYIIPMSTKTTWFRLWLLSLEDFETEVKRQTTLIMGRIVDKITRQRKRVKEDKRRFFSKLQEAILI